MDTNGGVSSATSTSIQLGPNTLVTSRMTPGAPMDPHGGASRSSSTNPFMSAFTHCKGQYNDLYNESRIFSPPGHTGHYMWRPAVDETNPWNSVRQVEYYSNKSMYATNTNHPVISSEQRALATDRRGLMFRLLASSRMPEGSVVQQIQAADDTKAKFWNVTGI